MERSVFESVTLLLFLVLFLFDCIYYLHIRLCYFFYCIIIIHLINPYCQPHFFTLLFSSMVLLSNMIFVIAINTIVYFRYCHCGYPCYCHHNSFLILLFHLQSKKHTKKSAKNINAVQSPSIQ